MAFQPGQSGNPNGRPKGIIDKRVELRGLLEPHAKDLIEKLIALAKSGDPTALRLCIERLLPRVKPDNAIYFELPEGRLDTGDNMLQIAQDITAAVASGQLSIEEAEKFAEFIDHQRRVIKSAEWQKQSEIDDAERKKYWSERSKEN
jgi:hypothetical protein